VVPRDRRPRIAGVTGGGVGFEDAPPRERTLIGGGADRSHVPRRVESADPEGVDYGWVMQTTFVLTVVVGAPAVALLSTGADLPTWAARATFALRVGAVVWMLTAVGVFLYARRRAGEGDLEGDAQSQSET
jgi:hypothetical protein